jgi:6,7-dimethyl-8-ribityllumazine synthase
MHISQRPRVSSRLTIGRGQRQARVVLIAARFHGAIARGLVRGAIATLRRGGISQARIRVLWVPGAFELPVVASRVARTASPPQAIIALGALIQGETPQYEVIAHAVAHGLTTVAVDTGIPVTFGVIVASTLAQARARADGSRDNRGAEAASAALALLELVKDSPVARDA